MGRLPSQACPWLHVTPSSDEAGERHASADAQIFYDVVICGHVSRRQMLYTYAARPSPFTLRVPPARLRDATAFGGERPSRAFTPRMRRRRPPPSPSPLRRATRAYSHCLEMRRRRHAAPRHRSASRARRRHATNTLRHAACLMPMMFARARGRCCRVPSHAVR